MTVTDIQILKDDQKQPGGWLKDGHDLNSGAGGPYLYLAWKKDGDSGPITALDVLDDTKQPREGFQLIDQDLNEATRKTGARLYLCFSRTIPEKPILELAVVISGDPDAPAPKGFTRFDKDLNKGAGGDFVFLCYRR
ncbi:hypothetical protein ACIRRH_33850 [Kitasatospora sp. NPDC101235]|uniref:hypothetical protein n=1 Tax=Kitasatospora sp. NPDC101235 TaxID=3364101 RepID=UPI00381875C0